MKTHSGTSRMLPLGGALLMTLLALPVLAHHGDVAVLQAPMAPSESTAIETIAGTLDDLVIENRITGTTARYAALRLADGQNVSLRGGDIDAFAKGAYVTATGRRNGDSLFVVTLSAAPPPPGADKSSQISAQPQAKQVQGKLLLAHADDFLSGKSTFNFAVLDDSGRTTPLKLSLMPPELQPGMSVVATGVIADDGFSLVATSIAVVAPSEKESRSDLVAKDATSNNVLVLLVKFADSPSVDAFTQAQVQQVMSTNSASVASYYNETSYGQHLLNVTVTNWLVSPQTTPQGCNYDAIAAAGNAAAIASGYSLGNSPSPSAPYQNIFYFFPRQSACGWAGLGYVGYGVAFNNGYNLLPVFAHELGHNFGLLHAASLNCNGQPITPGASGCTSSEYGDPFSVMGNQASGTFAMQFNAAQKALLGWIPPTSVATYASGTSTYTLTPLEIAGGGTYAVKVPVATGRTFWLEYRQRIGAFDGAFSYATDGAQVRLASPFQSICSGCVDDTELLFMPSGNSDNFYNAALLTGHSFADSGITMTVLSSSPSSLTVQVSSAGGASSTRGDFNGDAKADILWAQASTGKVLMQTMNGYISTSSTIINANSDWVAVAIGDFDGDGKADIIWQQRSSGAALMQTMNGSVATGSYLINGNADWSVAGVGDFNGDGKADILWKQASTGAVILQLMNGATSTAAALLNTNSGWTVAGVGDFNGDGKADILWRQSASGTVLMQLMNGMTVVSSTTVNASSDWIVAGIGDFNGDGKADILWKQASTGAVIMEMMNGASVASAYYVNSNPDWSVTGVGDFNGDGRADILWRQASSGVVMMQAMNGPAATSSTIVNSSGDWLVATPK
jgi:FG-GAP-like repeat/Gametolysin peptidase M11/FG-GAP repeat